MHDKGNKYRSENKIRAVSISALAALCFWAALIYPAESAFHCGNVGDVLRSSMKQGFAFLATGAMKDNTAVMFMISRTSGQFRVIGVDKDLHACILITGDDFKFAIEKKA